MTKKSKVARRWPLVAAAVILFSGGAALYWRATSVALSENSFMVDCSRSQLSQAETKKIEDFVSRKYKQTLELENYTIAHRGNFGVNPGMSGYFKFKAVGELDLRATFDSLVDADQFDVHDLHFSNEYKRKQLQEYLRNNAALTPKQIERLSFGELPTGQAEGFGLSLGDNNEYTLTGEIKKKDDVAQAKHLQLKDNVSFRHYNSTDRNAVLSGDDLTSTLAEAQNLIAIKRRINQQNNYDKIEQVGNFFVVNQGDFYGRI